MSMLIDAGSERREISDSEARQMTGAQLLLSIPTFHHQLVDDCNWTIEPVNAPAREIMRRLNLWEASNALG
jgi:hypothetical protein